MKAQIYLKINPSTPIIIEDLESVIIDENTIKIDEKTKLSAFSFNRANKNYTFVGKNRALMINCDDILYLITEV